MAQPVRFRFGPVEVDRDSGLLPLLEMANNHQGDVQHGINIVQAMAGVCRQRDIQGGIKLQFRRCDVYLHPGYREARLPKASNPLATRFLSTKMSYEQYYEIVSCIREEGMIPFSTPWDEPTVEWCDRMDLPVIKVASCFASDLPLLREIAQTRRPVVCSIGGASNYEVDRVVDLFGGENIPLALMHCVALYPTPTENTAMDQVRQLRERYPNMVIGYSGHEGPNDLTTVNLAVAARAAMLERHVGLPTDSISLNKYSMGPEAVGRWLDAALLAKTAMGIGQPRPEIEGEAEALAKLKRGLYSAKAKAPGEFLGPEDLLAAMPCLPGQFSTADIDEVIGLPVPVNGLAAKMPIWRGEPVDIPPEIRISSILDRVRDMLAEAKVSLTESTEVVLQHYFGLERFEEVGGVLINIVNREYCKMLIVMLPGQRYPLHHHIEKEETFHLLAGDLQVRLNDEMKELVAGDSLTIPRTQNHEFKTRGGMILEEISTTYIKGDSIYDEEGIPEDPATRKTSLSL